MLPIESSFLSHRIHTSGFKEGLIQWRELMIPSALGALLLNVITQGMCVRGVNRLTAVSPARTSLSDKFGKADRLV